MPFINTVNKNKTIFLSVYPESKITGFKSEMSRVPRVKQKKIPLTKDGNLQFNHPVPNKVKLISGEEFEFIRYTAITCDPDEFVEKKYSIRQKNSKRQTEIMIVITMYNEHDTLFIKTMTSVIKNVDYICSKWPGNESWKKIVVLIVADGRNKINNRILNVLSAMGCYQGGILQNCVKRKDVTAHLFEYTTELMVDSDFKIHNIPPVQIMLCLKEKNAKKLNSHRWSFNAFAALLKPKICILLDVGTKPSKTSIYHLWKDGYQKSFGSLKIPLTRQGNLQFDYPVPNDVKDTSNKESESIRYTAITCDPDEFVGKKYSIRQIESERKTEIMIVITMYNEHDTLFIKTMTSVIKNVDYICSKWPESESWKKIVVLIVADGRNKVNKWTLNILSAMGCYQDRILQNCVGRKHVTAHLFEYTTQLMVDSDFKIHKNIPPVQIMLCLKEKNAKKLNSHRWSFNAFAALLKPNICILLDYIFFIFNKKNKKVLEFKVGLEILSKGPNFVSAISAFPWQLFLTDSYWFFLAFDHDPNVGGACGEIKVDLGRKCRNLFNLLVASQSFEYKMSNILDTPSESVFGYISLLPGTFSAYRYEALMNGPLEAYFKDDTMHVSGAPKTNIVEAN
ncbi:36225_t:CDS:2, partial [Gigaspora margarita]